jgi:hypothetical protein
MSEGEVFEPAPPAEEVEKPMSHLLKGKIDRIALQNINKAQGHYTYNVHLHIVPASVEPPSTFAGTGPLTVRLNHKPTWKGMSQAERDALSPDGPKPQFSPAAFAGYAAGSEVEVRVRFSSQNLAHLVE